MAFGGTADLNWHHKDVVLVDMKWVKKTIIVHVEMGQFEEAPHQGKQPSVILSRRSGGKLEDVLILSGRTRGRVLVSLDHEDQLIGRIDQSNPNSAGTVKWEIIN